MKIVKATNYEFRTVIVVCHNPDDPAYVHSDGSVHPTGNVNGCVPNEGQRNVCTVNHRLEEFIWDGAAQFAGGVRRSGESFWEEICERCVSPPMPSEIEGLAGRSS